MNWKLFGMGFLMPIIMSLVFYLFTLSVILFYVCIACVIAVAVTNQNIAFGTLVSLVICLVFFAGLWILL